MLIDERLGDAKEHHATLREMRSKPHVLDDATVERVKRVNGESLEHCDLYEVQLRRWQSHSLDDAQQREVTRLQGAVSDLRLVLAQILKLADELAKGTIERQLAKSDTQIGLEYLSGLHVPR